MNLSLEAIAARDLEIVTIVFDQEIELFRLQARSLARNLSSEFRRIHVVMNEFGHSSLRAEVAAIVEAEFGSFERERVQIWSSRDLLSVSDSRGWLTQQILKLKMASHVEAEKYVVLDAKNHLIRKTGVASFIASDGRPYMARTWNCMPLKEYIIGSLKTFRLDADIADQLTMPSITPFVLYTKAVLNMITEIENIQNLSFDECFLSGKENVSEFGLYAAFFIKNNISLESAYWCDKTICTTLWRQWASTEERQLKQLANLSHDDMVMLGLHRNSFSPMSDQARKTIFKIWVDSGLFEEGSDAAAYWDVLEKRFAEAV